MKKEKSRKNFVSQLRRIDVVFNKNVLENKDLLYEYWNILQNFEADIISEAVDESIKSDLYWPRPARLRELCEKITLRVKVRTQPSAQEIAEQAAQSFQNKIIYIIEKTGKNYEEAFKQAISQEKQLIEGANQGCSKEILKN